MPKIVQSQNQQPVQQPESELANLAELWRGAEDKNSEYANSLVRQYQEFLRSMIMNGYMDWLDPDAELPRRFMPKEYYQRGQSQHEIPETVASFAVPVPIEHKGNA